MEEMSQSDQTGALRARAKHAIPGIQQAPLIHRLESQPATSNMKRLKLSQPRKPRQSMRTVNSQKRYKSNMATGVDWNEDLRPTDNEDESPAENNSDHSFIPSQDLCHEGTFQNTGKRRKSRALNAAGSAKRNSGRKDRKPAKITPKIGKLPLTALTAASQMSSRARIIGSELRTTPNLPNEQSIIEISSTSPDSSEPSTSSDEPDMRTSPSLQEFPTNTTGRGKTVAQKLTHALQGVDLSTKAWSPVAIADDFDQISVNGPSQELIESPPSRLSSMKGSANHEEGIPDNPAQKPPAWREESSEEISTLQKMPLNAILSPGFAHAASPTVLPRANETCISSPSPIYGANQLDLPLSQGPRNETTQTPESQIPLLTQQTPPDGNACRGRVSSTGAKSSIVDQNGSPRLKSLTIADMNIQMLSNDQQMLSGMDIDGNPATANFYYLSECSDSDCSNCSSDDGPILRSILPCSKYMRTMLIEYGLDSMAAHGQQDCELSAGSASNSKGMMSLRSDKLSYQPSPYENTNTKENHTPGTPTNLFGSSRAQPAETMERSLLNDKSSDRPSAETDPMTWIVDLKDAQSYAHSLLSTTNQVSHLNPPMKNYMVICA